MIDGFLIFFGVLLMFLEVKRGTFRSFVDMLGAIFGLKAVYVFREPFSHFLHASLSFSERNADWFGTFLLFFCVLGFFMLLGQILFNMTLFTIGEAFEPMVAFIFSMFAIGTLLRFVMIFLISFYPGLETPIMDSAIGAELVNLSVWKWLVEKLKPLTNPGELYI